MIAFPAFIRRVVRVLPLAALAVLYAAPAVQAQSRPARFLGREDILLYGIGLKVEPAHQTVPKDIATIVSTYLQTATLPDDVPPFAPDAVVKATLRGPSFPTPRELTIKPNSPFNIPPLTVPGTHTLENIRLVSGGDVLLRGAPEQVTIEVIEKLLVTQISARTLTAAEILERGLMFDRSNFQAYNFSAAFAIQDHTVDLNFAVLLPQVQGPADVTVGNVSIPGINPPMLPQLKTIIPDTLKLQTQLPNLSVVGFTLKAPQLQGGNFVVPPIPGVIVIPGDIGFLDQFFSVMLMVGNVAPAGSGLDVSDLRAEIVLPPGRDGVLNSGDEPLAMAKTPRGTSPSVQFVVQPGPDGKLGTADDIGTLHPGDSGNAEYLVEGRREGSHVIEMAISGTLHGLPVGPVPINGTARGSVLVRNPRFTLTFTHPEAVAAGERYSLDVTVTNTSESPANFVQLALNPQHVSGATILGDSMRSVESIAPGDSATVTFDLESRITGKVTAATLDSDGKVAGQFELKTAIGELDIPVSPDTLVLPKEASSLPKELRDAALGVLGKAYAVATAPPAAVPPDVRRFSRKIVIDRAVEVAEAGLRKTLHEPLPDTAAQLLMDFDGSNYARLGSLVKPEDLTFEQDNFTGFDELRRRSVRGDAFAQAVGSILAPSLLSGTASGFHYNLAQKWTYRPAHVSILASASAPLPVSISVVDPSGRVVGGRNAAGKVRKDVPYSDLLPFADASGAAIGELALLAKPASGAYKVRLTQNGPQTPYTLSLVLPTQSGALRQVVFNLSAGQVPVLPQGPDDLVTFTFELVTGTSVVPAQPVTAIATQTVDDPPPSVVSVIQQKDADAIRCDPAEPGIPAGRVVAVLFSEEVTPASVQDRLKAEDITGFQSTGNRIVGVALQPGRRIAFVALRDPIGPFVARTIKIDSATDLRGQAMTPFIGPIETTVGQQAGVVSGRVLRADGTPVPFANVRLFYRLDCGTVPSWVGISSKSADADGRYSWDYVLRAFTDKIVAIDTDANESRTVPFNIQRDGQQLNADIIFLGRGTLAGTTRSEAGKVLRDTAIRVTSLTDNSQYGATTDANGRFAISKIPVGNIYVEAVNVAAKATFTMSDAIPFAGATVERDITLLDEEQHEITVKHGTVRGHVLRTDGVTPAGGVPVFVWYTSGSQTGVACPGSPAPECAVAGGQTTSQGEFSFPGVPAGSLRVSAFDQDGLVQGAVRLQLAADATADVNVLLIGGLGTVTGTVVTPDTPDGVPVPGAIVGGGLSLVTTNASGQFTLTDVPVGKRDIVAVSEALKMSGHATIDLTRAGDTVNVKIVLDPVGSVSGTVVQADGVTPVANSAVYVFRPASGSFEIIGTGTTNAQGGYRIDGIRPGEYKVSSFNAGFTEGNIVPAVIKYNHQVFRADITWRGGGGRVTGTVFDDDGQTPLRAMVSLSGDQVQVAGGRVGVAFQYVDHFKIAETDFTTGKFTLTGALVGPVKVSAAGQFSPDPIAVDATIPAPNATVTVNLTLQPTSHINGAVLLPNGTQPAGAGVIVKYKSEAFKVVCTTGGVGEDQCDSIPQGIQEISAATDTDGRFTFPIVNAGAFTISVEDPSGRTGQIKGTVRAGETADLSVRLLGMGELSVHVFGSDKTTVIPGARVTVTQLNHPRKQLERAADQTGTVLFGGPDSFSEGEFAIEATNPQNGFAGRGTARITTDAQQVSVKVYLYDSVGTVSGKIFASNGYTPVPNAEVVLSNAAGPLWFGLSDFDGNYRVENVPLGSFRVEAFEAKTARRAAATGQVDVAGEDVPVNLTQAALGIVKGLVLDTAGLTPLKGWTVTLGQKSSSGLTLGTLQTTSAVDGGFLFPGTSRGTFTLTAVRQNVNGSAMAGGGIEREGEIVDVPLLVKIQRPLAGTISGTVLTPSGDPAGDRPVEICHPARSCDDPVQLTANHDGTFSLPDVPLGRFRVTAKSQTTHEAGSVQGELSFDGDIASVRVMLGGVGEIHGTVVRGTTPAADVRVELTGQPDPGCAGDACVVFTDRNGAFAFVNVPASSFTVTAVDPDAPLFKGSAGGPLNPGEVKTGVLVKLAPSFAVSGRVLLPGDRPLAGALAELIVDNSLSIFAESGSNGIFTFAAAPTGTYQIVISDPIGSGRALRTVTITGDVSLGDILLDVAAPLVIASTPAPAAIGVGAQDPITITFSEPVRQATADAGISLSGPAGSVMARIDYTNDDSVAVLTPLASLTHQTRYTLRVHGVEDRFGKPMTADYVATFTTLDDTPPMVVETSPANGTNGAPIVTPVRIRYSESINRSGFTGDPIALTGPDGAVAGRTDYLLGNTLIVFTPNAPLKEDAAYTATVQPAKDLAGNQQPAAVSFQFRTSDRTAPEIVDLIPANGGLVVEDGIAKVTADVSTSNDVAVVEFSINDVLASADRTSPFELSFRASPALYGPAGSTIKVSAIATDTSGNRGHAKEKELTVTADQPPTVSILAPANGLSAHNGDHVVVRVTAGDDIGVAKIGYRADTGNPADALMRTLSGAPPTGTEEFAFTVPQSAAPGTTLTVFASASDTKGQVAQASIAINVLDATPPTVTITGATSGSRVVPNQQTTVVVTAQDVGRIASVAFTASGIVTSTETRPVDPAQASVVTSFTVTIPSTAQPGQTLTLGATATDAAGNSASAAQVVLTVADTTPPSVTIAPQGQSFNAVPGQPVNVIVTAEDEIGVSKIAITATGAASFQDAKQVSPPSGSATQVFAIPVPATAQSGSQIQVTATATDLNNNTSGPASLTLTVISTVDVTLPASIIVDAGDHHDVDIQIAQPAPAGGVRIDFTSVNADVATAPVFVVIPEGQTSATARIDGLSGGTTQIRALIAGAQRAAMTVAVNGGIVKGLVRDGLLNPVAGVHLTISGGGTTQSAITGTDGVYRAEGVAGPDVSVRAFDPATHLYGHDNPSMARPYGFASSSIVLASAASIHGVVTDAAKQPVGAGVPVRILLPNTVEPLDTAVTNADSEYEFPFVTLGEYWVEAAAPDGRRGRATVLLDASGRDVTANIVYLGTGTVSGTVRIGQAPVANATLTFTSRSIFGSATPVTTSADRNGAFQFASVAFGSFTVTAKDPITHQGGSVSGTLDENTPNADVDLQLGAFGAIEGHVYRTGRVTPVPGALVRLGSFRSTTADENGKYRFDIVPLGQYSIVATDTGTRGYGTAIANLTEQGGTLTVDPEFIAQGRLHVTVADGGTPTPDAFVSVFVSGAGHNDIITARTGADGSVLIQHVTAGQVSISASYGVQQGTFNGTLLPDELKDVTIQLSPTGSVAGVVYLPGGQAPAAGAVVSVPQTNSTSVTNANGEFQIDGLVLGRYDLVVHDANGRLRAGTILSTPADDLVIDAKGAVAERNFTFVGLGKVTGSVLGTSVQNMPVNLSYGTGLFTGTKSTLTDGGGTYTFENVPVGPVRVVVSDPARQLYGEQARQLDSDGLTLEIDVPLTNNAITLPHSLYDANNRTIDVQHSGAILDGDSSLWFGDGSSERGAMLLDVTAGGVTTRFEGPEVPTVENGGREIAVRHENLAGLSVTRKVFVPRGGYFARYLEIFRNPTAAPITIDADVTSYPTGANERLFKTSSGDAILDVLDTTPDSWFITARDGDTISAAMVFQGADAALHAGSAAFTARSNASRQWARASYGWRGITIAPGQTAVLMHFVVQQLSTAASLASVQRLEQLPPEALAGLSQEEIGAVRNFVLPENGASVVTPLPSLTGTITGHAVEHDLDTPVPGATVDFSSDLAIFSRQFSVTANSEGAFTFTGTLGDNADSTPIPETGFTLKAVHATTGIESPVVAGQFDGAGLTAVRDVAFTNASIVSGLVQRHNHTAFAQGGSVSMTGGLLGGLSSTIGSDSKYRFGGVPAGDYSLTAQVTHAQGSPLAITVPLHVTAGESIDFPITLPATGTVTGTVTTAGNATASNVTVMLTQGVGFQRSTTTDTGGNYTLTDIPVGAVQVIAIEPHTLLQTSKSATVAEDTATTVNLTLVPVASVEVHVNLSNGQPADLAPVKVQFTGPAGLTTRTGTTDATGIATVTGVPAGPFTASASHPANATLTASVPGIVDSEATVPVTIPLPAAGSVTVTVTRGSSVPVNDSGVRLSQPGRADRNLSTNAQGIATFSGVAAGAFTVVANHPQNRNLTTLAVDTIGSEGQNLGVPITLPAIGTVTGTVTQNNQPLGGQTVTLRTASGAVPPLTATTTGLGIYTITGVPAGTFTVTVDNAQLKLFGTQPGTITTDLQTLTVNIPLQPNSVTLPTTLVDGNGFLWDVQRDGHIANGSIDAYNDGLILRLYNGAGATGTFAQTPAAVSEDAARELALRQLGFFGLDVTRKVFVPADGYFTRYLEQLTNPTSSPITVDLAIESGLGSGFQTTIVATSNGGTTFGAGDRWLVTDDVDAVGDPALAHVFAGANARATVSDASLVGDALKYRWNAITILPGQTVTVMHFAVQQNTRARATASAQRLAQLPAEALEGLSPDEIASIVNFTVPTDGSNPPAIHRPGTGSVVVHVTGGDGVAPVYSAPVELRSAHPIFDRTSTAWTDANGLATLTNVLLAPFASKVTDWVTGTIAPVATGAFADGESAASLEVRFSNAGTIRGSVKRANGAATLAGGAIDAPVGGSIENGAFVLPVVQPGTRLVRGTINFLDQWLGAGFTLTSTAQVSAGESTGVTLTLPPLGSIAGTVRSAELAPIPNLTVTLNVMNTSRQVDTDDQGHYRFLAVAPGAYSLSADNPVNNVRFTIPVTVTAESETPADITFPKTGMLTARLVYPDGSVLANARVEAYMNAGSFYRQGFTDDAGEAVFTDVPLDTDLVVKGYLRDFNNQAWRSLTTRLNAGGEPKTVTLTMHALATVRVYVKNVAGDVVPGATVYARRYYNPTWYDFSAPTNDSGYVDVPMPEGDFTVVTSFGSDYVQVDKAIVPADHGHTVEVTLQQHASVNVSGIVYAGDGVTPIPGASVTALDGTNTLATAGTDADGHYDFGTVFAPLGGFVVTAKAPGTSIVGSVTASFTQPGQPLTVNVPVPAAVVKGAVTYFAGDPVIYPNVFVTRAGADGVLDTSFPEVTATGTYRAYVSTGDVTVRARNADGLQVVKTDTIASVTQTLLLDLRMPATGTVTGTFVNQKGRRVNGNDQMLYSRDLDSGLFLSTDQSGTFTRDGVPVGPFTIEGCGFVGDVYGCETVSGVLTAPGATAQASLTLPPLGLLRVSVVDASGAPAVSSEVMLAGITRRAASDWLDTVDGTVLVQGVPEGTHLVTARLGNVFGIAEATVIAGRTTEVQVHLGTAAGSPSDLTGADGFRYDVQCTGTIGDGGGTGHGSNAYDVAYYLYVNGNGFPCLEAARLALNGRELVFGPMRQSSSSWGSSLPIETTRRVYSPASGGFVRYFDVLTNRTGIAQTVTVGAWSYYGPTAENTSLVVAPSATGNRYAVMRDVGTPDPGMVASPTIATVFAGANPRVPLSNRQFKDHSDGFSYEWTITLAPGQSAAVLHFGVQRDAADVPGAQAQAEALATLADPLALEGLSLDDRALVINFAMPGVPANPLHGTIDGRVVAGDGVTPLGGATVYATDAATNRVLASVRTNADGTFHFADLYSPAGGLMLVAAYGSQAANTGHALVVFATPGDAVTGVTIPIPMSVLTATVRRSGAPVTGATVLAAKQNAAPETYGAFPLGDGRYAIIGMPSGDYTITAADTVAGGSATAPASISSSNPFATVDLDLPAAAACAAPMPGLAAWWAGDSNARDAVYFGADGTTNTAVSFVPGKVGQAFSFDGLSATATLPVSARFESPFSVEAWVMPKKNLALQWIALRSVAPNGAADFGLTQKESSTDDGTQRFGFGVSAGNKFFQVESAHPLELGRFYHVVGTYDGTAVRIFVDGQLEGSLASPGSRVVLSTPLSLGNAGAFWPFDGAADEVKVYERALTAADVQSAFASGVSGTCTDLAIVTGTVPAAYEGRPYSARVRATGGTGPVTFAVTDGSPAPGVTMTADGALAGTPAAAGAYTFTVTATDSANHTSQATFTQSCGTCEASATGLVSFWSANGHAEDRFGGADGAMTKVTFAPGIDGQAFSFDGTGSIAPSGAPSQVNGSFTIEFWANPSSDRALTAESASGVTGRDGLQRYAIAPVSRFVSTQAGVGVSVGANGVSVFENGPSYMASTLVYQGAIDGWTHIAVVYRNNQPFLFVNGVQVREGLTSTKAVFLSQGFGDFSFYGAYRGLLDEIGMYNRALAPEEIAAIAASPIRARCPIR